MSNEVYEFVWLATPKKGDIGLTSAYHWITLDGGYRVSLLSDPHEKKKKWAACYREKLNWQPVELQIVGTTYVKYYTQISDAINACEQHKRKKFNYAGILSNAEEVLYSINFDKLEGKEEVETEVESVDMSEQPICGFPLDQVVRWMAREGWCVKEISALLTYLERKHEVSDIKKWIKDKGIVAELTKKRADRFRELNDQLSN